MKKETYCLACRKYTKNNNPKIVIDTIKLRKPVLVKNLDLLKTTQAMGILSNLGIRTPLSKVPLLNILF